jgi:hypothetical protein
MAEVSQELMYELLKRVHEDIGGLKTSVAELKGEMIGFRGSLLAVQSDIHNIYGTLYRQDDRLDRIEKRLELRELAEAQARFLGAPDAGS